MYIENVRENKKNVIRTKGRLVLFVVCLCSLVACTANRAFVADPECTKGKDLTVRWGEIDNILGVTKKYEIKPDGSINLLSGKNNESLSLQKIAKVDPIKYCKLLDKLKSAILKTQSLNVPGDKQRFVEYINLTDDLVTRGIWNSKYETVGSKAYREIYILLNELLPKE